MLVRYIANIFVLLTFLAIDPVRVTAEEIIITDTLESPEWFLNDRVPAPSSASIGILADSIVPFLTRESFEYAKPGEPVEWRVDTIGELGGRSVIDLMGSLLFRDWQDSTKQSRINCMKAIAIETEPQQYRLIYAIGTDRDNIYLEPSFLVTVEGFDILGTDCQMSGTGAFHVEQYWVWDSLAQVPRTLNLNRSLSIAQGLLLPKGHGIWKGGGPNIRTLYYEKWTWRDGDGNCCATGGKVRVQLGLRETGPYVKWGRFDFDDLEERAPEDSAYVNQPPRIIDSTAFDENMSQDRTYFYLHDRMYSKSPSPATVEEVVNRYVRRTIEGIIYDNPNSTPFTWSFDTIGTMDAMQLVTANYSFICGRCRDTTGKVILIEDPPNHFQPVYLECTILGRGASERDTILELSGERIIAVKGHRNFVTDYTDNYWVWDSVRNVPVSLFQQWVLDETLTSIIPRYLSDSLYVPLHRGIWHFKELTYTSSVWCKPDKSDHQTGGSVFIRFGLKNRRLQPLSLVYTQPQN
jgi:hypothetical protein